MQVIKSGRVVSNEWRHLGDDDALSEGKVTVSLVRLLSRDEGSAKQKEELGVRIAGGDQIDDIADKLVTLPLIVVEFPSMADGRGFSLARLLRDRYSYGGELRARGGFIRDQLFFLARVGFDAFEPDSAVDLAQWLPALNEFSVRYQSSADLPKIKQR